MIDLLPCPFCGGEAHVIVSSDGYGVECWGELCTKNQLEEIPTEAEAIEAWNTRIERVDERKTINKTGDFVTHDNRTTELREKLNKLVIELDRLDITLDSPSSGMTLGEYEQELEKLLDGFTQAIAATLGKPEIVRCGDCKHGHESDWPVFLEIPSDYLDCTGPLVETWDYYRDEPKDNPVPPDGFCKWGERRESE